MPDNTTQLYQWTRLLLRPFARILLKRGISYGEFAEAAKSAFVDAAGIDLALPGRKQTTSRISTITGLSRKEVTRLQNQTEVETIEALHKLNRAVRVISGWTTDSRFLDADHKPRDMVFEKGKPCFADLVKAYSGDITARTIADELTRIGALAQNADGTLRLIRQAYIIQNDSAAQLKLLCESIAELTTTIEHNLETNEATEKRFQRKVYYDNIPDESLAELKTVLEQKSQVHLEEINRILAKHDLDHNPKHRGPKNPEKKRHKIGLGIYYFEEDLS